MRALLLLAAALAGAAPGSTPKTAALEDARRLINVELRFKEAIEILDRALADPRITREERIEALRLLGIAYVARGATDSAEAAFGALLDLEPSYQLDPLLSPKIQRVFAHVVERRRAMPHLLEMSAVKNGDRVVFSARVEDAEDRLASVRLYTRTQADEAYEEREMERKGDRVEAHLEVEAGGGPGDWLRVEYYVIAKDGAGTPLVRVSDAENPSSVTVERPRPTALPIAPNPTIPLEPGPAANEDTPWYGSWWFWTIAAGVVAASTAIVVVTTRDHGATPMGTLDPIHL